MTNDLQNKIALITGAGRGMGRAIASNFAAAGAIVYVNDINAEAVTNCVSEINSAGGKAIPAHADISNSAQVVKLFATIESGRLDVLVNNAAISRPNSLHETSDEVWNLST